ncbi:ABC transporter substrate-binding protein [Propionibacterium australiense]|uniref:ABC transporter periplasmic binding domain n=1 Tax=Propionibacterium australiense TaxID=119981 RepID=A0A383S546_9ACTN|nr:ABC transporter substrate-binding protein [Propionibacterium australiense]RLP08259.1 ABC transporter substrate-binding protein [Propionibacterium australiense]SYZ33130.1 ABC transporter periplasmic binding domain [Propionibacterium australiense]VEH89146.1 corrinoid ABC transporter substrate-binding protein [Propionibacterium australiense]
MRTRTPLIVLAAVSLLAAGCSAGESGSSEASGSASPGFPLTITNCGRELHFDKAPERTVSLNQSSTEIQLSLGVADRMVGTATWTDPVLENLAEDNERIERLADNNASLETVLSVSPDFVSASFPNTLDDTGSGSYQSYADLGVPAYLAPNQCEKGDSGSGDSEKSKLLEMADVYQEIRDLAAIHGVPDKGDELVDTLQARLDTAIADSGAADGDEVTAAFWFANSESPYVAGGTGASQMIANDLKVTNVYADDTKEWPQVSWEDLAAKNPDVLVIGDLTRKSQTAETADAKIEYLKSNPVTAQMDAVRNERFIIVAGGDMNPSIRNVDLAEKLSAGMKQYGLR